MLKVENPREFAARPRPFLISYFLDDVSKLSSFRSAIFALLS
jgi:hypothetical protein